MTPEQFGQLLLALKSSNVYTLTGAADWRIAEVLVGVLFVLIGGMWTDMRGLIKIGRSEWKEQLAEHVAENKEADQRIWDAVHDCQGDCCPRRK